MARARRLLVREGEIAVYHAWSRCVQRAHLCGWDSCTKRNFDYRREWIDKLLKYQARVFAVDLANYSVLSNHMHLVVRTRPDIVASWSDEDVALRWRLAWPDWLDGRWEREPTDEEVRELLLDSERLKKIRVALSSLSWFMARCKEPIARLSNQEMERRGHFWEQRFACRELVDESAVLTCMAYVDANQVQAGLADRLEDSRYSAIHDRIEAARQREIIASMEAFESTAVHDQKMSSDEMASLYADCHLAPIGSNGPLITETQLAGQQTPTAPNESVAAGAKTVKDRTVQDEAAEVGERGFGVAHPFVAGGSAAETTSSPTGKPGELPSESCTHSSEGTDTVFSTRGRAQPSPGGAPPKTIYQRFRAEWGRRASDNPILPIPFSQYLDIARWAAERVGQVPSAMTPGAAAVCQSRNLDPDRWIEAVVNFERWFRVALGAPENLEGFLDRTGRRWLHGINFCRDTFG